jgi:hypothetical protein
MPPRVICRPAMDSVAAAIFIVVSVVMIARAASRPPCRVSCETSRGMAARMRSMGSGWPMTPVDPTKTWSAEHPNRPATRAAISRASASPGRPVHALAFPLFARMARALPPRKRCRARRMGAAATLLRVKTPAMTASLSETIKARSGTAVFLIPAEIPAAKMPGTAVMPPSTSFI